MMFSRDHLVYFGQGTQTRHTVARDKQFRAVVPTSPTYGIFHLPHGTDSADRTITAAGQTSTIDATSTTLAAAAGPGSNARRLTVASTVGFVVGKRYVLLESSRIEEIQIDGIDSGNAYLYLSAGLSQDWPITTTTVRGIELPFDFPASEADGTVGEEEVERGGGPYSVDWTATVDGALITWREIIWLRRMEERIKATPADVMRIDQSLSDSLGTKFRVHDALEVAVAEFTTRLQAHGRDPTRFYSDIATLAVCYLAAANLRAQLNSEYSRGLAERWDAKWEILFNEIASGRNPEGTVGVSITDQAPEHGTSQGNVDLFTLG